MNAIKRYEEDSTRIRDASKWRTGKEEETRKGEVARVEDREKDLTALLNISRRAVAAERFN